MLTKLWTLYAKMTSAVNTFNTFPPPVDMKY